MKYFNNFSNFDINFNEKLNIFYNKENKIFKINDHYIFLNDKIIVKKSELINEGLSDYLPKTTSGWIHLGVDVTSAIVDFIPGIGNAISFVIDVLHAVAYFIEAYFDKNNRFDLILGGIITAIFATIPGMGNIGSIAIKSLIRGAKIGGGGIFKAIIKTTLIPLKLKGKILSKLFNLNWIKNWAVKILGKHTDSWWFKLMNKIPIVNKMTKFVDNNLDIILKESDEVIKKEFKLYQKGVLKNIEKSASNYYKNMSKETKNIINEKDFLDIVKNKSSNITPKQSDIIDGNIPKNFEKETLKISTQIENTILNLKNESNVFFTSQFGSNILKKLYKPSYNKTINKEIINGLKDGTKINYKEIITNLIKKTPTSILKQIPKTVLKKGAPVLLKNMLFQLEDGTLKSDDERKNEVEKEDIDVATDMLTKDNIIDKNEEEKSFEDKWNLYESKVLSLEGLGKTDLVFYTPDKQGEDGKLLFEGGIFKAQDFTNSMSLYEDNDELFNDLVKIGKKKEDKKRKVRKGETKKWEKSPLLSTPYIEELDNQRFEFDFLIRERSKISLHKKEHIENIDWKEVFESDFLTTGSYKLNNSLYITLERKITEK